MVIKKEATRNGVKGHIVHVSANDRFVRDHYMGKDPRTLAKNKGK
jgi:hypothetical protein